MVVFGYANHRLPSLCAHRWMLSSHRTKGFVVSEMSTHGPSGHHGGGFPPVMIIPAGSAVILSTPNSGWVGEHTGGTHTKHNALCACADWNATLLPTMRAASVGVCRGGGRLTQPGAAQQRLLSYPSSSLSLKERMRAALTIEPSASGMMAAQANEGARDCHPHSWAGRPPSLRRSIKPSSKSSTSHRLIVLALCRAGPASVVGAA